MPEFHNISVQYIHSDLNITFHGRVLSFPELHFSMTPPNWILEFWVRLAAGKTTSAFPKRCKKSQQQILRGHPQEYAVVIPTRYKDPHGWADCVDRFIQGFQTK
jgi:hypothetical protein